MPRGKKLWGGRFAAATAGSVEAFTASIDVDARLYRHDIAGSIAHARMLARQRIIAPREARRIVAGLEKIRDEIDAGKFRFSAADEDIHMNIERRLIERIGRVGEKLHTARSRNDQVALDLRLYLRDEVKELIAGIDGLKRELARTAKRYIDVVMPGYTHLQRAQPVLFSHHLLAYAEMLERDAERMRDCLKRVDVLPLGSGALAGTTLPIDRRYVARLLGFARVSKNSIDSVGDRDFALEFIAAAAILFVHLSRLAEEWVLWSSTEFGFIELPDRYCTGSSMMPQKKNPDVPELVRGKSARVIGSLVALLTLMKAQPLAYNKDNQEDKPPLFDAVDTVKDCVAIFAGLVRGLVPVPEAMRAALAEGHATATDLADYLVRKGTPFRDAHEVVARAVREAERLGADLAELPLATLKRFSPRIGADVQRVLTPEGSVAARNHPGGTAPAAVRKAVARARKRLAR